ncbi:TonB-dependent receptor [Shewanella inventionis]|uniref:TonB-dependent receptor n=1 Tax=Shewanella inventionis TaxID=1738770 RepID=A0ABQ1J2K6_9GAMM|nr:TonB-dependent receptor [Shewanella inventionis]MCL1157377.1 TonB-dependent receptor [Shewanella inventionis]GGB58402.1 TonB-dependent receptor [Shewanella inventionis]
MLLFKPSLLTLALVAAGASISAYAADDVNTTETAEENIEVIQVTGIRRSLQEAQAVKMTSSSVVEAISAEDIGKLPDVSIAESLARLPGIAAQRLDGRANVVSIRGLGPDFSLATLNGREQASINDNRGVEFDQYPSELLNSVVVYKTPDAALMTQAIAGTVDMQTISPLKHGEQTFVVNLRGETNSLGALNAGSTDKGYRGSISYIDQFADDTIGIALGYSRMQSPNQEERWQAWGYPEDANGDAILGGAKPYVRSSELERDGVMAVIEFQPNEQFRSVVDVFYTKFYDEQILRGIEIPGQWGGGWANSGSTSTTVENGLVTEGSFQDAMVLVRNDINTRDADSISVGWNNNYIIDDNWEIEADLAMSKVKRTDIGIETYAGTGRGNGVGAVEPNLGFKYTGDGRYLFDPSLDYADPELIKLGGAFSWGPSIDGNMQDGFINKPEIEDELATLRLSTTYNFDEGFMRSVEFGVNYTNREKNKVDNGEYLTLKGYEIGSGDNYMLTVPDEYLQNPTSLAFFGMGDMLSYNALALYNAGIYNSLDASTVQPERSTNTWQVEEKVSTLYVKADFETEIGDMPLTGNFGVQAVQTNQSSNGKAVENVNGTLEVVDSYGEDDYLEWLPSMNIALGLTDSQRIVLSAARTMSRARMDKMNASASFNYDPNGAGGIYYSGSSGNPTLRPWMANQVDLSYENYFSDQGYFAIAAYYKKLENPVYNETIFLDFEDVIPGVEPGKGQGSFEVPVNGDGGHIAGIEASLSVDFGYFADALEGFGTILNGSYNDSEVRETADRDPIALAGLSDKTFNATIYYENSGFEARVSSRYRSDFLGEVTAISLSRVNVNVQGETVVDAQLGYDFTESGIDALYGLSVVFQVNNLTDEPFITYTGDDARHVRDYQNYGRNFMLGANYKF